MKHEEFICVTTIEQAPGDEWTTNLLNTKNKRKTTYSKRFMCHPCFKDNLLIGVSKIFQRKRKGATVKRWKKKVMPSSDIELQRVEFVIFIHS